MNALIRKKSQNRNGFGGPLALSPSVVPALRSPTARRPGLSFRRWAKLSVFCLGFGCAPGVGPNGLQCISSDVIDPMQRQARNDPYSENRFFNDHRAMRRPPEQTVPRRRPLPSDPFSSGVSDGGPIDRVPIGLTVAVFAEGKKTFEIMCAVCHGLVGDGDSVVARQMQLRPPPSLHEARIRALSDGELYRVISEGYGMMPPYRTVIAPHGRWATVAYVRALQRSQDVPLASAPPDVRKRILGAER